MVSGETWHGPANFSEIRDNGQVMKIFIDDSGSFGWKKPGRSLFCGLTVTDRSLPDLFVRFFKWKQDVAKAGKRREVKGAELTTNQLISFVQNVLLQSSELYLTLVGVDTALTSSAIVDQVKTQSAEVLDEAAKWASKNGKPSISQFYSEMAGWLRNRSVENFMWILVLAETVFQSVQHSIVCFMEPEDDAEFEHWDVVVDNGFIRRQRHVRFWQEWLRNELIRYSLKKRFVVPNTWAPRNHPWYRKYHKGDDIMDTSDLYRNHMYFAESRSSEGLQLADVCAHICFRYHKQGDTSFAPYSLLLPRIVGENGRKLTLLSLDDRSIWKDSAAAHLHPVDAEELYRARAAARTEGLGSLSRLPRS